MKYRNTQVPLALLALLAAAACDAPGRTTSAPDPSQPPLRAAGEKPRDHWTTDDELARAARAEAPGLAGFYLEDDGTPVILLTNPAQNGAAHRYLAQQIAGARKGRLAGAPQRPVFRTVAYDFAQLRAWGDQLEGLLAREDVYTLDVDEVRNRVLVGVRDQAAIGTVRAEAVRAGIPAAALHVQTERAPGDRQTVRDYAHRLLGGYQIQFSPDPYDICTAGFTATYNSRWIFVTNSHCTVTEMGSDGGWIMQPVWASGNEVGWEVRDRGNYACNGWFTSCRRSDAAYIERNGTRAPSLYSGKIVKTAWNYGGPGGLDVTGEYDIIRRYTGTAAVGTWLDKTGRTSGSTYGQVKQSCVSIDNLRCQDISDIWSEPGDSGSPVYVWLGNDQVELYGIMWGGPDGDWNTTYSSRLSGIEQDLGSLSGLCAPTYPC